MDKRQRTLKLVVALLIIASAFTIAVGALIQYYGEVQVTVPVEQAIWIDGKRFNETIVETLPVAYGGCTVYANHTLENRGDDDAQVKFTVVNITDSQGNLVTDGSITVHFIVNGGQQADTAIISGHATVDFQIAIHFHYAITPDTYTITVRVEPYPCQAEQP